MKLNISAVICTYNSAKNIEKCVDSLIQNEVGEIIIVDGGSKDDTIELIKHKVDFILHDNLKGLAVARNIGISKASKKYILNVGSDNYFGQGVLLKLLKFYEKNHYVGISMQTIVDYTNNKYLAFCMNKYRKLRFEIGNVKVIGTPTLFETNVLKNNPYSETSTHSDDENLCSTLSEKYQAQFYISEYECHESSSDYISEIKDKWRRYGISDYEVFKRNKNNWNFLRKFKSILHPFLNDFILPIRKDIRSLVILPFLVYITSLRYIYWIKSTNYFNKLRYNSLKKKYDFFKKN